MRTEILEKFSLDRLAMERKTCAARAPRRHHHGNHSWPSHHRAAAKDAVLDLRRGKRVSAPDQRPNTCAVHQRRNGLQGMLGVGVSTDTLEKVLERLATSDKATIVIERQPDGKMRVTSGSWDWEMVFLREQVLEVGNVEG
ncbi:MAG: hypothetical protein WBX95_02500 [Xanthobacteraceae bacterium]